MGGIKNSKVISELKKLKNAVRKKVRVEQFILFG